MFQTANNPIIIAGELNSLNSHVFFNLRCRNFLNAAHNGDLRRLKNMASELDCGKGFAEVYLRIRDKLGRTALHFTAEGGKTHVCKYLMRELKLDVNLKDNDGGTPLHSATIGENLPTAVFLIDNGANLASANVKGLTALHHAAQTGRIEFLRLLVTRGAEVDATSRHGTPLQCAAAQGRREAVKFLLDKKANPNAVLHHIFTPLISSIVAGSFECMSLLLKAGADPNLDSCVVTPLEIASAEGEAEMIKFLLKAGANPNAISNEGLTPLEISALSCNHEAVQILFPATSHIATVPNWNYVGIMKHVHSEESKRQRAAKKKENFHLAMSKGEAFVKSMEYLDAIYWYTMAINLDPLDAKALSNRSLCWARLNEGDRALSDAEAAIKLRPDWANAHYRAGVAYKMVKNYPMAAASFSDALKLDPESKEIRVAFEKAVSDEFEPFGFKVGTNLKVIHL